MNGPEQYLEAMDAVEAVVESLSGIRNGLIRHGFTPETAEQLTLIFFASDMSGDRR